ncbi:ABC transporter permease [Planococcus citreus]|uniref:Putative ABC transport system permease protein n=1 Tax=Planococcus citreus TaxID=1373 RepID=A0A497YHM4_9BACL|nr:FtsX-like permease family protein [Planococcus citreus]RLJ86608.1 putative ABC transport system permease protein [Planococcus citreus]
MNIVNKVTVRHLKENKRRSLVTIIGAIISVAMITAVATLGVSFLDLLIRGDIERNGEWHVQYQDANVEQLEAIEQDGNTEQLIVTSDGFADFDSTKTDTKHYLYFRNFEAQGMDHFPLALTEGRLPENANEVVISETLNNSSEETYEVGDTLTAGIGERMHSLENRKLSEFDALQYRDGDTIDEELVNVEQQTFDIVGIIERPSWEVSWLPMVSVVGFTDTATAAADETFDGYVVASKINNDLFEDAKAFAKAQGIPSVDFNSDLLRLYGATQNDNLRTTMFSLVGIIMGIVVIGSVALIYNAFAISVSERARHLGMLASVGATKRQKRNSVFFEGAIIGAISIPLGIVAGLGGIWLTFRFINTFLKDALNVGVQLEVVVTPMMLVVAIAVSALTILISTYIPAQKASKISAIDAIRQTQDIKLTGKAVKTSKWVRKLFGLEAEIGLKNLKRNRKRYLATVFSLVISIVLFLSVTYFTNNLKISLEMTQSDLQYDIQLHGGDLNEDSLEQYASLPDVTEAGFIRQAVGEAHITQDRLPEVLMEEIERGEAMLIEDRYLYNVSVYAMDNENFEQYAQQVGVEPTSFGQETPRAIVIDEVVYQNGMSGTIDETKTIKAEVGETIELLGSSINEMGEEIDPETLANVEIAALTDEAPTGVTTSYPGSLDLIVPMDALDELGFIAEDTYPFISLATSDPMKTEAEILEINEGGINVSNVFQRRQQQEQLILLMQVFTYGFITLISLISIANIFNTISTSIQLRKREFAMLRSVGMTPKGFNKMICYESLFYGVKALAYGLPISFAAMFAMHYALNQTFSYGFAVPWGSVAFVIVVIFLIVGAAMLYSIAKIKNDNIIESLKQENA